MSDRLRVARTRRYPVKSMRGEIAPVIDLATTGVVGDRRYALVDAEGRLGSGKAGGRFRRVDGLLEYHARHEGERTLVVCPDGRELDAAAPGTGEALAAALGHPVELVRADNGAHVDASPVHLLTTASLAWLARTLPGSDADERRFRPNLVIEAPGETPVEQDWIGAELAIGETVRLRVTEPTERCGMVALGQSELRRDPAVLRHITREADLLFGVYAEVLRPGRVTPGDPVRIDH